MERAKKKKLFAALRGDGEHVGGRGKRLVAVSVAVAKSGAAKAPAKVPSSLKPAWVRGRT